MSVNKNVRSEIFKHLRAEIHDFSALKRINFVLFVHVSLCIHAKKALKNEPNCDVESKKL